MTFDDFARDWQNLAAKLNIHLPTSFIDILVAKSDHQMSWKFLSAAEALSLKAELDIRYNYPGREWRGIPFVRSTVSEDIVCFDLKTPPGQEAKVLAIGDWHGPRWEFSGETKNFVQWLTRDPKGHLT